MENNKIKTVFLGMVKTKYYELYKNKNYEGTFYGKPYVNEKFSIENKKFYSCDMEKPPISNGEEIYIDELNLLIVCDRAIRSTNGETIIYTRHILETIENEYTTTSLNKANEELKIDLKNYEIQMKQQNLHKNKKWYQFWIK